MNFDILSCSFQFTAIGSISFPKWKTYAKNNRLLEGYYGNLWEYEQFPSKLLMIRSFEVFDFLYEKSKN